MIFYKRRWLRRGGRFCDVWLAAHQLRADPGDREHIVDVCADLAELLDPPAHRPPLSLQLSSALVLGTARRTRQLTEDVLKRCSSLLDEVEKCRRDILNPGIFYTANENEPKEKDNEKSKSFEPSSNSSDNNGKCNDVGMNYTKTKNQEENPTPKNKIDIVDDEEQSEISEFLNRNYTDFVPVYVNIFEGEVSIPVIMDKPKEQPEGHQVTDLPESQISGSHDRQYCNESPPEFEIYMLSPIIEERHRENDNSSPALNLNLQNVQKPPIRHNLEDQRSSPISPILWSCSRVSIGRLPTQAISSSTPYSEKKSAKRTLEFSDNPSVENIEHTKTKKPRASEFNYEHDTSIESQGQEVFAGCRTENDDENSKTDQQPCDETANISTAETNTIYQEFDIIYSEPQYSNVANSMLKNQPSSTVKDSIELKQHKSTDTHTILKEPTATAETQPLFTVSESSDELRSKNTLSITSPIDTESSSDLLLVLSDWLSPSEIRTVLKKAGPIAKTNKVRPNTKYNVDCKDVESNSEINPEGKKGEKFTKLNKVSPEKKETAKIHSAFRDTAIVIENEALNYLQSEPSALIVTDSIHTEAPQPAGRQSVPDDALFHQELNKSHPEEEALHEVHTVLATILPAPQKFADTFSDTIDAVDMDTVQTESPKSINAMVTDSEAVTNSTLHTEKKTTIPQMSMGKGIRGLVTTPATRRRRRLPGRCYYSSRRIPITRVSPPLTRSRRSKGTNERTFEVSQRPSQHNTIQSQEHQAENIPGSDRTVTKLQQSFCNTSATRISPSPQEHTYMLSPLDSTSSSREHSFQNYEIFSQISLYMEDQRIRKVPDHELNINLPDIYPATPEKEQSDTSTPSPLCYVDLNPLEHHRGITNAEIHEPPRRISLSPTQRNTTTDQPTKSSGQTSASTIHLVADEQLEIISLDTVQDSLGESITTIESMEADSTTSFESGDGFDLEESNDIGNHIQEIKEREQESSHLLTSNVTRELLETQNSEQTLPRYVLRSLSDILEERNSSVNEKEVIVSDLSDEENNCDIVFQEHANNVENENEDETRNGNFCTEEFETDSDHVEKEGDENSQRNNAGISLEKNLHSNEDNVAEEMGFEEQSDNVIREESHTEDEIMTGDSDHSQNSEDFNVKMEIYSTAEPVDPSKLVLVFCKLSKFPGLNSRVKKFWKNLHKK